MLRMAKASYHRRVDADVALVTLAASLLSQGELRRACKVYRTAYLITGERALLQIAGEIEFGQLRTGTVQ